MNNPPFSTSVSRVIAGCALCVAVPWAAAAGTPTVLSFDDVAHEGTLDADYGGLDWTQSSWLAFSGLQDPYTPHSGDWRVATDFGSSDAQSTIRFSTPAVFDGAWFSGYGEATVTMQLFLGNTLVATSATLAPTATPAFLASGYASAVDRLVFLSPQQAYYAMDDFTFEAAAVPEPRSWALLAGGLGVLAMLLRRSTATPR
jgi:hypothetical protein